ncbi:hypothetical protein Cal7507_2232 [Calothrix sp. PCC 7507]|nr:hypothetical protein Cal7507_2232 [Calothrix sp. PCC 7507]
MKNQTQSGGLRGVKPGSQSNSDLCVHGSLSKGRGGFAPAKPGWGNADSDGK